MAKKKEKLKDSTTDLKSDLSVLQENLRVLRFTGQNSKNKNVKEQANLKKSIARILTKINSK